MAHFRPPSRDREAILKGEGAEWASRSFSVQGEASHLLRGMLGFKTYRYQDSSFQQHRRHLAGLQRPTIATVGVLQDEQSTLMVVLGFCFVAVMAIIRWWLCLTPLLVRPLFDTVHSCPHQHPYPFPEELEQEQAMIDQELLRQQEAKKNKKGGKGNEKNDHNEPAVQAAAIAETGNSEKKRLQALEEEPDIDTTREATNSPSISEDQQETSETRKGRRAINTAETLEGEADRTLSSSSRAGSTKGLEQRGMAKKTEETVPVIKRLPWRMRRALRKAEARRLKMVTSSQDIGRYSLFYELGAVLFMDRWKQTVLMLGQTRLEADED
ncbi:hypothetical protein BGW38_007569 [Lunasporangiospora selenospora]|uniref:Uncharacterized protein n=1 Tax=Lunasporangiospora selenospora TaxID=979761 RepID=A0A9P6KGU3_9FUNG|nr:hypothetical protein BGW38_007569 [Lunasporangiospora selenospora]